MKRIVLLLVLLAGIAFAGNPTSTSVTLNASTFTAVTIPHSSNGRDIGVATSDSSAWIFSDDAAGTTEITIPAPGSLSYECRKDNDGVLFYAKASAGTPTLSVIVGLCKDR